MIEAADLVGPKVDRSVVQMDTQLAVYLAEHWADTSAKMMVARSDESMAALSVESTVRKRGCCSAVLLVAWLVAMRAPHSAAKKVARLAERMAEWMVQMKVAQSEYS